MCERAAQAPSRWRRRSRRTGAGQRQAGVYARVCDTPRYAARPTSNWVSCVALSVEKPPRHSEPVTTGDDGDDEGAARPPRGRPTPRPTPNARPRTHSTAHRAKRGAHERFDLVVVAPLRGATLVSGCASAFV